MFKKIMALSVVIPFLIACTSTVQVEYDNNTDFSGYKNFLWVDPYIKRVDDPILDSQLLTKRVHNAVSTYLTQRGYKEVEESPDFFVTYHTSSKEKLRSSPFSIGVGYGRYYGHWGHTVLFDGPDIRSYEESFLILDIINCSDSKLIWRGWDKSLLTQKNYTQPKITESIENILLSFPPVKKISES